LLTYLLRSFLLLISITVFLRAMLCISAAYAVVRCLSVRHVRVLYRNGWRYGHMRTGNRGQAFKWYQCQLECAHRAKPLPRPKSQPNVIRDLNLNSRINPDPDVCRSLPKCGKSILLSASDISSRIVRRNSLVDEIGERCRLNHDIVV